MKRHRLKDLGQASYFNGEPDWFTTWCGISDADNPSEDLIEYLTNDWENCDCKRCKQFYKKNIYKQH